MNYLEDKRVCEVIISKTDKTPLGKCILGADGSLISKDPETPDWLIRKIKAYERSLPCISGTWEEVISSPDGSVSRHIKAEKYIDITMGGMLEHNAKAYPDREAIVDATTDTRITNLSLLKQADYMSRHFMDLGLVKGDTVAVIMKNSSYHFAAKYGAIGCGAVIVNISPYEKPISMEHLLNMTEAKMVVVRSDEIMQILIDICPELKTCEPGKLLADRLPNLRTVLYAGEGHPPGVFYMKDLIKQEPETTTEELQIRKKSIKARDVATIIHTSGTTGMSKGVMLKHSAIAENALQHVYALKLTGEDRIFLPVPMFHAFGAIGSAVSSMIAGATAVCLHRPKVPDVLKAISKEKCTVVMSVPSFFISLVDEVKAENFDTSKLYLRMCVMAGAQCTEKNIRDTREILGIKEILVMYGMTEAGPGVCSTVASDPDEVKCQTVGKPWPGTEVKLFDCEVDEHGMKKGEICVRGYNVMKGYYRDPASTAKVIDKDGWLHTGDIGSIREDGNLMIVGRIKDIIIRNGENISPREVEDVLEMYPAVHEAIVVGAHDERSGEAVYAYVTVKEGFEFSEQAVREFCQGKISKLKIPERVIAVEDFPKSPTGKILRKELRKMADEDHSSQAF